MTMTATPATATATYRVSPIDPAVVEQLRVRDDAGNAPVPSTDGDGGSPLRCCLRVSRPGEPLLLASYAPLRRWAAATGADPGPYDEVGPVFIHPEPCAGRESDGYPEELRKTDRVFRGYNESGGIVRGELAPAGSDHEAVLRGLFDDPTVTFVHARALGHGCFTFAIDRAR
jgi:hypothetical protein